MKLIAPLAAISLASAGFIPNLLEDGWKKSRDAFAKMTAEHDDVSSLVQELAKIDMKDVEKPAYKAMQYGVDWIGKHYQQLEDRHKEDMLEALTMYGNEATGVDTAKLAVKLSEFYKFDEAKAEELTVQLFKELMPTMVLKLLRNSFGYINIDNFEAVVPADVETRLIGMYLDFFCKAEGVSLDDTAMRSLRGDQANKRLSKEEVLAWSQNVIPAKNCSAHMSALAAQNWHVVGDAATQAVDEVDTNYDGEFNYNEFSIFQAPIDDDCSMGTCEKTKFQDEFCMSFNKRNRNFSSDASEELRIIMVVDQSGSMSSLKSATIQGYNWFLRNQMKAELAGETSPPQYTLSKFNNRQSVDSFSSIKSGMRLTHFNYFPRGGTRLYDSLECIFKQFGDEEGNILMMITDGEDNASQRSANDIKKQLEKLIKEKHWVANYIGANHDATKVGTRLGVPQENCVTYQFTKEGMKDMYKGLHGRLNRQRVKQFMYRVAGKSQN